MGRTLLGRAPLVRYVFGRVAQAVVVLWAAYTVSFAVLYLLPGDPLSILLAANNTDLGSLSAAELAAARHRYGLDQPVLVQYGHLLVSALHGDFGTSTSLGGSVVSAIAIRLPGTLALASVAVLLGAAGGFAIAYLGAWIRWRPAKLLIERLPAIGMSAPGFWVALLLIQLFAFQLHWFPSTGSEGIGSVVLPAVTLAIPAAAVIAQVLGRGLDHEWSQPYVQTALAKGLSTSAVQLRHALRNAALPAITILGLVIGNTVTNAVVVETVFSRQGVGQLAQQAVLAQDIPVVQAIVVLAAALFVTVNLVVDLIYPLLDPRVVQHRRTAGKVAIA